ncbi:hypothetical protein O9G_000775 [Rozella allomycis CSF55]|uniref:Uncharacterized protein n=1 Tax=Rozella allomycis (strain CSF55) TaxID=988480 RepID=A0A075ARB0_ROZAC|nr:hypothetical protein O9G_000775 [Rozella allomycis CSF55]|eukprot:EPZ32700.1 hypothetical protein O9G_000775 [Rozella allomycis CSF55]
MGALAVLIVGLVVLVLCFVGVRLPKKGPDQLIPSFYCAYIGLSVYPMGVDVSCAGSTDSNTKEEGLDSINKQKIDLFYGWMFIVSFDHVVLFFLLK